MADGNIVPFDQSQLPAELQAQIAGYLHEGPQADTTGTAPSFPRIKALHAGACMLQIGGEGGEARKEISGIVIHNAMQKSWWKHAFGSPESAGNAPPECFSFDGVTPRIDCEEPQAQKCGDCKHDIFGSDIKADGTHGLGKACRDMRRLFILLQGETFPSVLTLPPTSLRAWTDYVTSVYNKTKLRPRFVVTKISAVPAKSKGGVAFTGLTFQLVRPCTVEEVQEVFKLAPGVETYANPPAREEYAE